MELFNRLSWNFSEKGGYSEIKFPKKFSFYDI
jgi:hypothetical protein